MFSIFQIIYGKILKLRTDCFRYLFFEYGLFIRISFKLAVVTKKLIILYSVQETYWKSVVCFSPHCSTKFPLALCKAAINILTASTKACYVWKNQESRKKKLLKVLNYNLQFFCQCYKILKGSFGFKEQKKNCGVFNSCQEETSSMVRI